MSLAYNCQSQSTTGNVTPNTRRHGSLNANDADRYVSALIDWLHDDGVVGWISWGELQKLSYEFSCYTQRQLISSTSLSKVLSRRQLRRRQRYLKPTDARYRQSLDCGHKRPRILMIELPNKGEPS